MAAEASSKSAKPSKKGADSGDFRQNESYRQDTHRLFPQSAIAEKGVISSFLLSPREVGALCGEQKITKEHFHLPAHASIYACLLEMWDKGKPIDLITVTQLLQDQKQLDQS